MPAAVTAMQAQVRVPGEQLAMPEQIPGPLAGWTRLLTRLCSASSGGPGTSRARDVTPLKAAARP